jgi:hypothetical protein
MSSFHCSWEWHFAHFKSRLAPLLYNWGCRLANKSDSFYPSAENMASHFCRDRTTVFRALQELVAMGWAEVIHQEPGKPVVYRFIDHEEWARNHPDECNEKDVMPWEGQGDPLGRELYAVSGGLAKFLPYQMTGLRKSGFPDEQIKSEFRTFLDRNPQTGSDWQNVYYPFRSYLIQLAKSLSKAAAEKNSRSDPSRRSDSYPSRGCDSHPSRRNDSPVA